MENSDEILGIKAEQIPPQESALRECSSLFRATRLGIYGAILFLGILANCNPDSPMASSGRRVCDAASYGNKGPPKKNKDGMGGSTKGFGGKDAGVGKDTSDDNDGSGMNDRDEDSSMDHMDNDACVQENEAGSELADSGQDAALPEPAGVFQNEAEERGLIHENVYSMPATMGLGGPGVCTADFDSDYDFDLYFPSGDGNILYENNGAGVFARIAFESSEDDPRGPETPTGCLTFDFNNDGFEDIFATGIGDSRLYRNLFLNEGRVAFLDVTETMNIEVPGLTWSATAGDIENDGDLDLAVARYGDDRGDLMAPNLLFVNHESEFQEEGEYRGLVSPAGFSFPTFTNLFFDFDRDGDVDYLEGNDGGLTFANRFFLNDGTGHFENAAALLGLDFSRNQPPFPQDSGDDMGIAVADLNRDGQFLEMVIPNYACRSPLLFECHQEGGFASCQDAARDRGLSDITHTNWGVALADFNQDGAIDAFIGSAETIQFAGPCEDGTDLPTVTPPQLFFNQGDGYFSTYVPEENDILGVAQEMFGSVAGDFDNDGDVDLVVATQNNNPGAETSDDSPLYLNNIIAPQGNGFSLNVLMANRRAIGATISVTTAEGQETLYTIVAGGSFASASSTPLYIGLGEAEEAAVSITWPGGEQEELGMLQATGNYTFTR